MIYTYYYGVMCVGCARFISLNPYRTTVERGMQSVDLGIAIRCPREGCGQVCIYQNHDLVYSQSQDEMVPLDR
jgi:hypothetical protein